MEKLFEALIQKACDNGGLATWVIIFWLAVAGVIYALKKNGFITIGKPAGRRRCDKYCDDHRLLKAEMTSHKDDISDIEAGATNNFDKLHEMIGKVYGKIDEMNKTLSEHIGYCRGVQDNKVKARK
jgi:hypothetical protein